MLKALEVETAVVELYKTIIMKKIYCLQVSSNREGFVKGVLHTVKRCNLRVMI